MTLDICFQRLLDATDKLVDSSKRLEETKREIIETEEIAVHTMRNLRGQTEQIQRTHQRLGDVDDNLSRARNLVTSMTRRAYANKAMLTIVAGIIILALFIIIIRKITG